MVEFLIGVTIGFVCGILAPILFIKKRTKRLLRETEDAIISGVSGGVHLGGMAADISYSEPAPEILKAKPARKPRTADEFALKRDMERRDS